MSCQPKLTFWARKEVKLRKFDFDPLIDYQKDKDPNALDFIGKKVRVHVSYYGPEHKELREVAGVTYEVEEIVSFIPNGAFRCSRIALQDYWFAT